MKPNERPTPAIQVLDRVFSLLDVLASHDDAVALKVISERTGLRSDVLGPALAKAQAKGLVEIDGLQVRASARGFDFLSDLQALFLK